MLKVLVPAKFINEVKKDDVINTTQFLTSKVNTQYLARLLHNLHVRSGGTNDIRQVRDAIVVVLKTWDGLGLIESWESGSLDPVVVMNQINRYFIRQAPKLIPWIIKSRNRLKYSALSGPAKLKFLEEKAQMIHNGEIEPEDNIMNQKNELGKRWDQMMPDDYNELDNFKPEIPVNPHEEVYRRTQGMAISKERRYGWGNMGNWRHRFDADEGRSGSNFEERLSLHTKRDMSAYLRPKK
jgi:hypothetical protein